MANGKIRATIALDGDREYKQALRECKKETQELKGELSTLSAEYRDNENSIEALTKRNELLTEKQKAYKTQLEAALDGLKNAKTQYNEYGDRIEELSKELEEAKKKQDDMKAAGLESSEAYKEQERNVEELQKELDQYSDKQEAARKAVNSWQKEVTTANKELNNCDKELAENDKYLDEAKRSADGCATSIDKYGNEVKEAAEDTGKLSVSLSDMIKNKIIDLAGDALVELGRKAIDAAKYVIEVGSSFESQMSKVQAISGASATEMTKLTEKAEEMGRTTKFTAEEAGQGLEYMALAGWKTDDMLQGLDGIMALAAASGTDLGTTSDIVTDALTAFGESAGESGRLADIMAAASSNANTNVEMMGETFKYAAPVAGALGYSMEDTAEAVGLMANAGIKGSQAGTSLRSIMTRLATDAGASSTKLGALGTLTEELGVQFYNADGTARNLNDVLTDARAVWSGLSEEEQVNYANTIAGKNAMSGWLALMNAEGDSVDTLHTALENCDGAAKDMSVTMQDNLQGKLELLNSATEGLGIALYGYFSDKLSGAVDLATGFISGITEAITPHKTEIQEFIDQIETSQKEVAATLDTAKEKMNSAYTEMADLDAKKQIIIDLQEIINKGGELNEFQKFQMQNAVEDLSGTMPELAANFDEATGSINLTNKEIETLFDNARDAALQTAMLDAQAEAYRGLAEATIEKAKADNAAEEAQKQLNSLLESTGMTEEQLSMTTGELGTKYLELRGNLNEATAVQETANEQMDTAQNIIDETEDALSGLTERTQENTEATDENAVTTEEADANKQALAESVSELAEEEQEETETTQELTKAQQEAIDKATELIGQTELFKQKQQELTETEFADWCQEQVDHITELEDAYNSLVEKVTEAMKGYVGALDMSGEEGSNAIDNMISNLNEKTASLNAWVENMTILGQMAGSGFSQQLYDTLLEEGPEKAGEKVQALVDALNNDTEKFYQVSANYDAAMQIETSAATLASYSSAAKNYMGAVGQSIAESKPEVQAAVENTMSGAVNDANVDATGIGEEAGAEIAAGIEGQAGAAESATGVVMDAAVAAGSLGVNEFNSNGALAGLALGTGLQGKTEYVKGVSEALVEAAAAVSDASYEPYRDLGSELSKMLAHGMEITSDPENAVKGMVSDCEDLIRESVDYFRDTGEDAGYGFAEGIDSAAPEAYNAAEQEGRGATDEVAAYAGEWSGIGYNMAVGLANGIYNGSSYAINAAIEVARNALQSARAELQINSPSKAFEDIGELSDEGLALGFERNRSKAAQSAAESARAAMQAAQDELSGSNYYTDLTQQIGYAGAEQLNRISSVEIGRADTAGAIRQLSAGMSALTGLAESLSNPQAPNVTVMIGNREFKGYIVNTAIEGMGQKQKNLMRGAGA